MRARNPKVRRNPKVGNKQPSLPMAGLFGDGDGEDIDVPVPARYLRRETLEALSRSDFSDQEWDELEDDVRTHIEVNDETLREERIEKLKVVLDKWYEGEDEGYTNIEGDEAVRYFENFFDARLDEISARILQGGSRQFKDIREGLVEALDANETPLDVYEVRVEGILGSTSVYDYRVEAPYHGGGAVWSREIGKHDVEIPLDELFEQAGLSDWDACTMEEEIKEAFKYTNWSLHSLYHGSGGRGHKYCRANAIYYSSDYYAAYLNVDKVVEELNEEIAEAGGKSKKKHTALDDNIVYEFHGGQKEGFYVADLPAKDLRHESRELGICVGDPRYGYAKRVTSGDTKIFSLRTAGARSKFTVEADLAPAGGGRRAEAKRKFGDMVVYEIRQVKGKANRLPEKANEVDMLAEFITWLGIDPAEVNDMKAALHLLPPRTNPRRNPGPVPHCGFCAPRGR